MSQVLAAVLFKFFKFIKFWLSLTDLHERDRSSENLKLIKVM